MFEGFKRTLGIPEKLVITQGDYRGERVIKGDVNGQSVELREHIEEGLHELGDYGYNYTFSGSIDGVELLPEEAQAKFAELVDQAEDTREFRKDK